MDNTDEQMFQDEQPKVVDSQREFQPAGVHGQFEAHQHRGCGCGRDSCYGKPLPTEEYT